MDVIQNRQYSILTPHSSFLSQHTPYLSAKTKRNKSLYFKMGDPLPFTIELERHMARHLVGSTTCDKHFYLDMEVLEEPKITGSGN